METAIDGKCPSCGRPVYPKVGGGFTHDAPAPKAATPAKGGKPAPAAEDPQGPEQHTNQPA